MIKVLSRVVLRAFGWRVSSVDLNHKKFIIIGAPHTSNWDFPIALLALASVGLQFSWVGKHTLFTPPFGFFFRYLGGIPVDRNVRLSFIDKMTKLFDEQENLKLAIAPEGTRSKNNHWKTGFYHIAIAANVPVALGFVDYAQKKVGIGPLITLSGDLEKDFEIIRNFYSDKSGKFPDKQSDICVKKRELLRSKG